MDGGSRVLLVDDDIALGELVGTYLTAHGFAVTTATTGAEGLSRARADAPDAVLLDVMLPDADGFELCRTLRAESAVPILMLTARGDDTDRIVGLELGADDYLPKPFNPRELVARLKAVLRRARPIVERDERLVFGRLVIDPGARRASVDGRVAELTAHQFDLLWALATRAGRVLSRNQLMVAVRGEELEPFDRSIDVHISRIRAAIEDDPRKPRRILTRRGSGYVFVASQDD
ncbi:MAG: response regulator transcription factor [Myxococcota bacterium]